MKCKDMDEFISAYTDGELSITQKRFVEEHVRDCPDCRATMEKYSKIRQQLLALRQTPAVKDLKAGVLSKARDRGAARKIKGWVPPAAVRISTVGVLLTVLLVSLIGNFNHGDSSDFWSKVAAATENVSEFKIVISHGDNPFIEVIYNSPDILYTQHFNDDTSVNGGSLRIGNQIYVRSTTGIPLVVAGEPYEWSPPGIPTTSHEMLAFIGSYTTLTQLSDETLDGVECNRYLGGGTSLASYRNFVNGLDPQDPIYPQAFAQLALAEQIGQNIPIKQEIWIGKSDYLIHQIQMDEPASNPPQIRRYYYKDIEKIPTVIQSGVPLPGWYLKTNISLSSDQTFEQTESGGYTNFNYTISLINTSQETLVDVRLFIFSPAGQIEAASSSNTNLLLGETREFDGHISKPGRYVLRPTLLPGESPYPVAMISYTTGDGINCLQGLVFTQ